MLERSDTLERSRRQRRGEIDSAREKAANGFVEITPRKPYPTRAAASGQVRGPRTRKTIGAHRERSGRSTLTSLRLNHLPPQRTQRRRNREVADLGLKNGCEGSMIPDDKTLGGAGEHLSCNPSVAS